jgi:serine/threonine protein kinase/AmiR/NasT family two-component response regulator
MTKTLPLQSSCSTFEFYLPPTVFHVGQMLGKYLLTGKLGSGGAGTVYRALDPILQQERAIKVLGHEGTSVDHAHIRHEAALLSRIQHPNIVSFFEFEESEGLSFLVMEYVEGVNLSELLNQVGRLDTIRALDLMIPLASGLRVLNSEGIIHRDIKPGNVLLTKDGTPKLADLGSGFLRQLGPDDTLLEVRSPAIVGTAYYMAPEQVQTPAEVDQRADIYALGSTFYHMITGVPPFEAPTLLEVIHKKATATADGRASCTPPHELNRAIPEEVSRLIMKMLAPQVEQRYSDYESLLHQLRALRSRYKYGPGSAVGEGLETTEVAFHKASHATKLELPRLPERSSAQDISSVLRLATTALANGKRVEAKHLLVPWKTRAVNNEAFWLLLSRTVENTNESLVIVSEGLRYLPQADRLSALREQLESRLAPESATKTCPFCSQLYPVQSTACSHCGGRTSISKPDIWATHQPSNPAALRQAIFTYQEVLGQQADLRKVFALALAHLNLREYQEALPYLQQALQMYPGFPRMREQIQMVKTWLRAAKVCRGHIVIVTAFPTMRQMLEKQLRAFDYRVTVLGDGKQAAAKLERLNPDVIVLASHLPGPTGYRICSWLKKHPTLKKTPVVLLTEPGVIASIRAQIAGCQRRLVQPLNSDELLQVLSTFVVHEKTIPFAQTV